MNASRPFFSVVTPSFNQASYVEGCIRSVLEQGVDDFEHIIFDGGSTDGSTEIFARYPHLQWTSEPDRGQAHALNKGFARARGDVICWLNTDDQYLPGTFEIVRRELSRPSVDVIYGDAEEVYFDGRPRRRREAKFPSREAMLRWWTKEVDILQPAVFFRRSVLQSVGPLREDLFIAMDLEFWWRVSERFPFTGWTRRCVCSKGSRSRRQSNTRSASTRKSAWSSNHSCRPENRTAA
jgi:glycosyltransferase involved in cell wall biosynthesis